jgi:hypothetical protein
MFALTRPHRHIAATLALITFAMAPTVYVVWTAWRVKQPGHIREVEAELSRAIGLHVSLAGVRYPRPGTIVLSRVAIGQDEPPVKGREGRALATARVVRLRRDGRELSLDIDGLVLRGSSPRHAIALASAMLPLANDSGLDRISLAARECAVDVGAGIPPYSLRDLAGMLEPSRSRPTATASFKVEQQGTRPRCELSLARERRGEANKTYLTLKTMDGEPVTARVLEPFFASHEWLGRDARVDGELRLSQIGAADWDAQFRGSLLDVDLATLVGRLSPGQRLGGRARITFQSARWADQPRGAGWLDARGELIAGPGQVGSELLRALQGRLHFRLDRRIDLHRATPWSFQALGLAFELSHSGELRLEGALGGEFVPGAVIVQDQRVNPLASAPEGTATVASLIRALVSGDDSQPDQLIPASYESQALQRYLPAPPSREAGRPVLHAN